MIKSSKWNDRNRGKDSDLKLRERKMSHRARTDARFTMLVETSETIFDMRLDRVIDSLCREAGI